MIDQYRYSEDFPYELTAIFSPELEVLDYEITTRKLPVPFEKIKELAAETIRIAHPIVIGIRNSIVAGFAITEPLECARKHLLYAVGVYVKYMVTGNPA